MVFKDDFVLAIVLGCIWNLQCHRFCQKLSSTNFLPSTNTLFYVCNITMRTKFIVRNTVTINTFSCIVETTVLNQSESLPLWFSWRGKSPTSHLRWIACRTNIIFCYFSNFRHGFRGPFFMLFLKAPTFCRKKILK